MDEGCGDCEPLQTSVRDLESGLAEPLNPEKELLDSDSGRGTESEIDPWDLPEFKDDCTTWSGGYSALLSLCSRRFDSCTRGLAGCQHEAPQPLMFELGSGH